MKRMTDVYEKEHPLVMFYISKRSLFNFSKLEKVVRTKAFTKTDWVSGMHRNI